MLTVHTYRLTNLAFRYLASHQPERRARLIETREKVSLKFPFNEAFNNVILSLC